MKPPMTRDFPLPCLIMKGTRRILSDFPCSTFITFGGHNSSSVGESRDLQAYGHCLSFCVGRKIVEYPQCIPYVWNVFIYMCVIYVVDVRTYFKLHPRSIWVWYPSFCSRTYIYNYLYICTGKSYVLPWQTLSYVTVFSCLFFE